MIEQSDALLAIAEIAATFAGFAALVTLFARRRVAAGAAHDLLRLRLVIATSVVVVVTALVPVALAGVLEVFVQAALIAILVGLEQERQYGLYVSSLVATLSQAAFVFLRLVESTFGAIVVPGDGNAAPNSTAVAADDSPPTQSRTSPP